MVKMYLLKYDVGSMGDYLTIDIFVTNNKKTAEKYVEKFNFILEKWKKHFNAQSDDFYQIHYIRIEKIFEIKQCYFVEIELR